MNNYKEKIIIIDGKETNYTITTEGVIYSLNYKKKKYKHPISLFTDKDGYKMANLHINGKHIVRRVSRLVATAFIPVPKSYLDEGWTIDTLQVNHIKGDGINKQNNHVSNLEWCTPRENIIHAYKHHLAHGLQGEKSPKNKYKESLINDICKEIVNNKLTLKQIAKKFNVSRTLVDSIYYRRTWVSISNKYDFSLYNCKNKVNEKTVYKICNYIENSSYSLLDISEILNVPFHIVKSIYYKQTWRSISKEFDFSSYNKNILNKRKEKI